MCLAVPVQVKSIENDHALVEIDGVSIKAQTSLIPDLKIGEYVIIHAGFIIERLSKEEAHTRLLLFDDLYKKMGIKS